VNFGVHGRARLRSGGEKGYIVDGKRIVGYDNERGKGDHRHVRNVEYRYRFTDVETLLDDFLKDIEEIES